jgi:HAD superfamily hydrolase (TIGR01509 family)
MDGVLIDSEPFYNIAVGELIRGLGYPYGEAEIAKTTGASFKSTAEILTPGEPKEKVARLYVEALVSAVKRVPGLIGGVSELLDSLRARGVKMALGSSSPKEVVDFVAAEFGLNKWMDVTVTGSDSENGKPAPDIYLKCAEQLGVTPGECLVIEDSINGVKSGKNAGMTVCAFTGTRHHAFDLSEADFELKSYSRPDIAEFEHRVFPGAI